jgi:hypothetical protein
MPGCRRVVFNGGRVNMCGGPLPTFQGKVPTCFVLPCDNTHERPTWKRVLAGCSHTTTNRSCGWASTSPYRMPDARLGSHSHTPPPPPPPEALVGRLAALRRGHPYLEQSGRPPARAWGGTTPIPRGSVYPHLGPPPPEGGRLTIEGGQSRWGFLSTNLKGQTHCR